MADRTLKCRDCGAEFTFTEGEQAFYKEKGFENDPVRCPDCRRAKKQQRNDSRGGDSRW
jgi:DNA-directed RNA polymerase subunit RPC12/RpoP